MKEVNSRSIYAIVVTFNGEKWVDRCLNSLVSSTIPVHVIVIDNGSYDKTIDEIREKFSNIELIESDKNIGFGQANNIGLRRALEDGADYVFLLNQDAWVENDTIEKLLKSCSKTRKFGVLSPVHLNGTGNALDLGFANYVSEGKCQNFVSDLFFKEMKELYEVDFVNAAAWLIPMDTIKSVGGFSPVYTHYGEDVDYIARIKYKGYKVGLVTNALIFHARDNMSFRAKTYDEKDKIKKNFDFVFILTQLTNPNYSSMKVFYGYTLNLFTGILKNLLQFNLKKILDFFKLHFLIIKIIPKIIRCRSLANNHTPFLLDSTRV